MWCSANRIPAPLIPDATRIELGREKEQSAWVDGMGCAPLPPPAADFLTAMGRTNDAILYGSHVQLFVSGSEDAARGLADQLSCTNSRDYGQTFADIFKSYRFDFYQIDPQLFAPAEVMVTALESGRTFRGGQVNEQLLDKSFGSE